MEVQKKRCCNCNTIVEENINFCPDCGNNQFQLVDKDITMELRPEDSPWYNQEISNITEIKNKTKAKKSNKRKIIILAVVLLIMFGGPLMIMLSDASSNDSDISNQAPRVEYTKGELVSNVYYNEWADLKVLIPEGYYNATEDEYANATDDVSDCLLFFYEPSGVNMIIEAEDISKYPNVSVETYLNSVMEKIENNISSVLGSENVDITYLTNKQKVQLHGYNYVQLSYQLNVKGQGYSMIQSIYARKFDNRVIVIVITGDTEENEYLLSYISNYE